MRENSESNRMYILSIKFMETTNTEHNKNDLVFTEDEIITFRITSLWESFLYNSLFQKPFCIALKVDG